MLGGEKVFFFLFIVKSPSQAPQHVLYRLAVFYVNTPTCTPPPLPNARTHTAKHTDRSECRYDRRRHKMKSLQMAAEILCGV